MYLTVCRLHGPGYGSSVGECISLSVLSMGQVMIAQWENECISLSAFSGSIPDRGGVVRYYSYAIGQDMTYTSVI